MTFQKIALPYPKDALAPYISEETMSYHYEKHHQAYADKLNQLIENTDFAGKDIVDIVKNSNGALYNNAAQFWNHNFFWNCLSPKHDQVPSGKLAELIDQDFGSFASFKEQFISSAVGNFGSGWTWLVLNQEGKLEILNMSNAQNPLHLPVKILLGVDVREHAYYIDTRNNRGAYLENFFHVINWGFVAENLG
ncbi:superoxide dismutase [SR1 bacterium human oral taxon HOT-345]|nr:superoxide dismutase [SR1 bacterium human oral taxon HOT-345]